MADRDGLTAYLQRQARLPFDAGTRNCAHLPAGWVLIATGRDPLAVHGGLAPEISARLSGQKKLLRAFFDGARSVGLIRTHAPQEGAVGTIRAGGRHRCAIRTANGWVFRDEGGLIFAKPDYCRVLMAWEV